MALTTLYFRSIDESTPKSWLYDLIARNLHHLQHLELGLEERMVNDYHHGGVQRQHELSKSIYKRIQEVIKQTDAEIICAMPLLSLGLCGLDFQSFIAGDDKFTVNFHRLTSLKLESCSSLIGAFNILANHGLRSDSNLDIRSLKKLMIRQEGATNDFSIKLADFLVSLSGLESLEVLLEGSRKGLRLLPILEKHGETLHTFVWDERIQRRISLDKCPSLNKLWMENLEYISQTCPNLVALGICTHWKSVISQNVDSSMAVCGLCLTLSDSLMMYSSQIVSTDYQSSKHYTSEILPEQSMLSKAYQRTILSMDLPAWSWT